MCERSDDCSAFHYQQDTQTCELGLKGKAVQTTSASQASISIYVKPGIN